jgi:hypothetical protein
VWDDETELSQEEIEMMHSPSHGNQPEAPMNTELTLADVMAELIAIRQELAEVRRSQRGYYASFEPAHNTRTIGTFPVPGAL